MKKIRVWQQLLPTIDFTKDGFVIHNFRDFSRTSEDYSQKQNYTTEIIKYDEIKSVWFYVFPFTLRNTIAHTMIWFVKKDETEFCVSREAQFVQWKDRNLRDNLISWYRAIVLRGDIKDFIGLRDNVRWEKWHCYHIKIQSIKIKELLEHLAKLTNETNNKYTNYSLISKNCASGIWSYIYKDFDLPKRNYRLILTSFLPEILLSKSYIYPDHYELAFDTKNNKVKKLLKSEI